MSIGWQGEGNSITYCRNSMFGWKICIVCLCIRECQFVLEGEKPMVLQRTAPATYRSRDRVVRHTLETIGMDGTKLRMFQTSRTGSGEAVYVVLLLPANGSASMRWLGGKRDVLRGRGLCTSPRDFGGLLKINWNQASLGLQSLFVFFYLLETWYFGCR